MVFVLLLTGNFQNSAQSKDCPTGRFFGNCSHLQSGPPLRIKIVVCDSMSWPKVGRYYEAVLVACVTILQCTYRFGNQAAVLHWIKEGT